MLIIYVLLHLIYCFLYYILHDLGIFIFYFLSWTSLSNIWALVFKTSWFINNTMCKWHTYIVLLVGYNETFCRSHFNGLYAIHFNALLRSKLRNSKFVYWEFRTILVYIFYSETNYLNHTSFGLIHFTTHVYYNSPM
jgi:hypothetical protein